MARRPSAHSQTVGLDWVVRYHNRYFQLARQSEHAVKVGGVSRRLREPVVVRARGFEPKDLIERARRGRAPLAKGFFSKYPQTTVRITAAGRKAVTEHWKRLDALKQEVQSWPSPRGVHLRASARESEG